MFSITLQALQTMIESALSEVNTQLPAKVISYDPKTNRAVVKPSVPKRMADDESSEPPQIVEVPIVWTASGGGISTLTMPIKPGDGVMLSFQQRSLEGWLSGKNDMPDDPRQFDLSDCVAIPGCQASGITADPTDVVLRFDKAEFRMKPDGTIVMGNDKGNVTIDGSGNLTLHVQTIKIETPARNFTLETHGHPQGGDSHGDSEQPTGPPISGSELEALVAAYILAMSR
jgi:Phage protein Gp138 N-terminal domain